MVAQLSELGFMGIVGWAVICVADMLGAGMGRLFGLGLRGIGRLAGLRAGCESVLSFAVRAGLEDSLFGRGRVGQTLGGVVLEGECSSQLSATVHLLML